MGKTKNSALDRIRANIKREPLSKSVESWSTDDDEFIVYWMPITLADKQKIQKYANGDDQLTTVYTLIFKAIDEKGDLLFSVADKSFLMNEAGSSEVEAIALDILGVTTTGEPLEK